MILAGRLRNLSIAQRLFLTTALWSLLILIIAGALLTALYRRATEQAFDDRLGVYLKALVADVATPGEDTRTGPGQLGEPQFELSLSGWYWQVTRLDGERQDVKASRSLFAARLPRLSDDPPSRGGAAARRGYVTGPEERRLRILERVIDVGDDGLFLVQVAADVGEVERDVFTFETALAVTFLLLALALIGSGGLAVRYGLAPLRRLRQGVAAIRQGKAEQIETSLPPDLAPLADELNLLVAANREIVGRARTQVGNLAHGLKTPISVILNEAGRDETPLADKVREQAGVMSRQVTYYLDRARAAAGAGGMFQASEIAPAVAALIRTFEKIYRERDLVFAADIAPGLRFRGESQDFEEMLGNLLDNSGKWARRQIRVAGETAPAAPGAPPDVVLTVDDDGPGLSPEQRAEATKRGRRLDETKPGSGLGLSIVVELASTYGGALTLEDSPLGGLRARLRLPGV